MQKEKIVRLHLDLQVFVLKALDTFDSCQRPVFSLGVSQHMQKINKPMKT